MTSNNKEAIELLKTCVERLQEQGFSSHGNTVSELNEAIDLLLQDNEDTEVEPICGTHGCDVPKHQPKPSSKVEKLKDNRILRQKLGVAIATSNFDLAELILKLIEDEE